MNPPPPPETEGQPGPGQKTGRWGEMARAGTPAGREHRIYIVPVCLSGEQFLKSYSVRVQ